MSYDDDMLRAERICAVYGEVLKPFYVLNTPVLLTVKSNEVDPLVFAASLVENAKLWIEDHRPGDALAALKFISGILYANKIYSYEAICAHFLFAHHTSFNHKREVAAAILHPWSIPDAASDPVYFSVNHEVKVSEEPGERFVHRLGRECADKQEAVAHAADQRCVIDPQPERTKQQHENNPGARIDVKSSPDLCDYLFVSNIGNFPCVHKKFHVTEHKTDDVRVLGRQGVWVSPAVMEFRSSGFAKQVSADESLADHFSLSCPVCRAPGITAKLGERTMCPSCERTFIVTA